MASENSGKSIEKQGSTCKEGVSFLEIARRIIKEDERS
jgi:hypothetical protein